MAVVSSLHPVFEQHTPMDRGLDVIALNNRRSNIRAMARWFGDLAFTDVFIWLGLTLSILAVYAQLVQFDFVNYDDDLFVYRNAAIRSGVTLDGIRWAFTSVVAGHWVPITLLSHLVVYQFFQMDSGMHHVANVLFHGLASILLFSALKRSTGARWPSAFVALLFAVHSLHVESVAWVSERKDVLSACFWFLALYAYVRYAEQPDRLRYLLMALAFCLGLLSKPMLVTFPLTLLLLDFWPLRRAQFPKTLWEKLPLMALSAAASLAAYLTQRSGGAGSVIPLAMRIGNALISYVIYIRQMFWPSRLAVFYPYPDSMAIWKAPAVFTLLTAVSIGAILTRRTRPYFATGWFWYLGTLVPVIGLVKVGEQSHADHFMYIPMVGLSMILAWGAADVVNKWPRTKFAVAAAGALFCVFCLTLAWRQTRHWRNSETLYDHAITATGDNWLAEGNLGLHLMNIPERRPEALAHLQNALRLRPDYPEAENNMGLYLAQIELCEAAIPHFETAVRIRPDLTQAYNNLALCLTRNGKYGEAIGHLETALRLQPDYAAAHFNLGMALSKVVGRDRDAIAEYETGLRTNPIPASLDNAEAHRNLGQLLLGQGRTKEAIAHFEAAQRIQPNAETSDILTRLRPGPK